MIMAIFTAIITFFSHIAFIVGMLFVAEAVSSIIICPYNIVIVVTIAAIVYITLTKLIEKMFVYFLR